MTSPAKPTGFTLIEMIVAVGIFVIILQIVAGAYGRFVSIEREGIGQQEMQEDIRLFLQLFNREARTGFGNTFQPVIVPKGLVFRNQENSCVLYYAAQGRIFRTDTEGLNPAVAPDANCADQDLYRGVHRQLTDGKNTVVENLTFEAVSAQPTSQPNVPAQGPLTQQGFIVVNITVRPNSPHAEVMRVQSAITSRQFIPYTY